MPVEVNSDDLKCFHRSSFGRNVIVAARRSCYDFEALNMQPSVWHVFLASCSVFVTKNNVGVLLTLNVTLKNWSRCVAVESFYQSVKCLNAYNRDIRRVFLAKTCCWLSTKVVTNAEELSTIRQCIERESCPEKKIFCCWECQPAPRKINSIKSIGVLR